MVIEIFEKIDTYKRLNETDTFFRFFLDIQLRSIFFFLSNINYQIKKVIMIMISIPLDVFSFTEFGLVTRV